MKTIHHLRLCLILATLGCAPSTPSLWAQATPSVEADSSVHKLIPTLKIRGGPLSGAIEELTRTLEAARLPGINVILDQPVRTVAVPDLVLRNVSGPNAVKLIAVSAGCDMIPIGGNDGQEIGFRVFTPEEDAPTATAPKTELDEAPMAAPSAPSGANPAPGGTLSLEPKTTQVLGYGGKAGANATFVRVYGLGGITHTTKFTEVEASLKDILKADGVSADAAKLAFHERTNVLIVTADPRVHDLVTHYLAALQENVAAAMAEEKRGGVVKREIVEAVIRLEAERDLRARVTKQLAETEDLLRTTRRELDRIKTAAPKSP